MTDDPLDWCECGTAHDYITDYVVRSDSREIQTSTGLCFISDPVWQCSGCGKEYRWMIRIEQ